MPATIHNPHDKLFKTVFSDPEEAGSFFQAYLPPCLVKQIDWNSLTLLPLHFIDEAFKASESDLLFCAQFTDKPDGIFLYFLFEHQSKPDKWMRFRLLKYMCRIWDESFKENPEQQNLIPILPVVFYQGKDRWTYSTAFKELFDELVRDDFFIPEFDHVLIDQSGSEFHEIQGTVKARLVQLLMKAAFHGHLEAVYDELFGLLSKIPQTGGINYLKVFIVYIITTQGKETFNQLTDLMKSKPIGGRMLTAAEEYWLEGKKEGKIEGMKEGMKEGKIEIIESFLKAGIQWDIITKATGITFENFQQIKAELKIMESSNN